MKNSKKHCKTCGDTFFQKRKGHKFCCTKCSLKDFHKRHPEHRKLYSRKWRYKTPLLCHYCNEPIPLKIRKGGLQFCSNKCRIARKKESQEKARLQKKKKLECYKLKHGCKRCGYSLCTAALDFHRLDSRAKKTALNQASWSPNSKKVKEELKKCILLCKNCHSEIHAGIPFDANAMERIR